VSYLLFKGYKIHKLNPEMLEQQVDDKGNGLYVKITKFFDLIGKLKRLWGVVR
jgi:hypothetical protein